MRSRNHSHKKRSARKVPKMKVVMKDISLVLKTRARAAASRYR